MESVEEQNFYVVQTQGSFRNVIGEMTGMAVYAHVRTRLGNDMAAAETVLSDLEQNGTATVRFSDSLAVESRIEIRWINPRETTRSIGRQK
jgi:hypothetical protein